MSSIVESVEQDRAALEGMMNDLLKRIGDIQIGNKEQFPFGWRKSAKGRTVWRLLEEVMSQNLETRYSDLGMTNFQPAESEVGVYDFKFSLSGKRDVYTNVKSSIVNRKRSKDDISKARLLEQFFSEDPDRTILIATVEIDFLDSMALRLQKCSVVPVAWLPDIYVNPSNNGNLQSSYYKDIDSAVRRTGKEFLKVLRKEIAVADAKRAKKRSR